MFTPKRGAAAADEILKSKERYAYREDDGQMTTAERTQSLSLDSKIAKSITETKPKNREGNHNENDQFFH